MNHPGPRDEAAKQDEVKKWLALCTTATPSPLLRARLAASGRMSQPRSWVGWAAAAVILLSLVLQPQFEVPEAIRLGEHTLRQRTAVQPDSWILMRKASHE
ncbi:MAG: hypothetical protein AB7F75_08775 [Planctomycetota bacterium]